ncbi:hypothetical protein [Desulfopila aestuarii]|uniref:Uncharacterized protein n=1 Tax=Desulfopila aestuarii DSM 18488 TaxID=1121416 RepID=A0A1M7Y5R0_9BACT|nr:hypothetical protein [Desulfopila aestuarii]SHO47860.1 hypothetical protein SAMN02745220_02005 [Desulfopila aestuarii DSM 18488]
MLDENPARHNFDEPGFLFFLSESAGKENVVAGRQQPTGCARGKTYSAI